MFDGTPRQHRRSVRDGFVLFFFSWCTELCTEAASQLLACWCVFAPTSGLWPLCSAKLTALVQLIVLASPASAASCAAPLCLSRAVWRTTAMIRGGFLANIDIVVVLAARTRGRRAESNTTGRGAQYRALENLC
jgi:hypothetical protein